MLSFYWQMNCVIPIYVLENIVLFENYTDIWRPILA